MCGITLLGRLNDPLSNEEIRSGRKITDVMRRRGPDGEGHWVSGDRRVYLGHRRLAIIDLTSDAAQPMHLERAGLHIVFNGEIYNYQSLRKELETAGHQFRTNSDTEVLLHGYEQWGEALLQKIRGMFAFAIWDEKNNEVFLARDPYGIKPLYYSYEQGLLRVASQVKAMLAGGGVDDRPDPAGWVGFLTFGSVPEPWTTHVGIRNLPAGTCLRVTPQGAGEPRRYASLAEAIARTVNASGGADLHETVHETLLDSVRSHLVSDVPVGAFLSAGVDSGTLVALMREVGYEDIRTVTLGFEEFRGSPEDEVPLAEEVANRYGTKHTTRIIGRKEFLDDWPKILAAMDQPSVDGANTWLVSKAAREAGIKVVVSGVGGDELFGGYSSFHQIPRWVRTVRRLQAMPLAAPTGYLLAHGAARLSARVPRKLPAVFRHANTFGGAYFARRGLFMPWELKEILEPDFARAGLREFAPLEWVESLLDPVSPTGLGKVMVLESALYLRNQLLRDADWASMDHSLELRTPLVDWRLLTELGPVLAARSAPGKGPLAAAPKMPLSGTQIDRPKTGFGLPLGRWLNQWFASDTLNPQSISNTARGIAQYLVNANLGQGRSEPTSGYEETPHG